MAEVYPIKYIEQIKTIRDNLTKAGHIKIAEAFWVGCLSGLRSSDLLRLTFKQFENAAPGEKILILNSRSGELNELLIVKEILESIGILKRYYRHSRPRIEPVYLFQSTSNNIKEVRYISVKDFARKLKEAAQAIGITDNIASQTPRKTFGYHLFKQVGDISVVQKALYRQTRKGTFEYIGIKQKEIDEAIKLLDYK